MKKTFDLTGEEYIYFLEDYADSILEDITAIIRKIYHGSTDYAKTFLEHSSEFYKLEAQYNVVQKKIENIKEELELTNG